MIFETTLRDKTAYRKERQESKIKDMPKVTWQLVEELKASPNSNDSYFKLCFINQLTISDYVPSFTDSLILPLLCVLINSVSVSWEPQVLLSCRIYHLNIWVLVPNVYQFTTEDEVKVCFFNRLGKISLRFLAQQAPICYLQ